MISVGIVAAGQRVAAVGGGGSAPPVAGYTLNLDAFDITGVADGANISGWTDSSSAGNDATSFSLAGSSFYPKYRTAGINGHPSVEIFDANGYLRIPQFLGSATAVEVLAVLQSVTNAPNGSNGSAGSGLWKFNNEAVQFGTLHPFSDGTVYETFCSTTRHSLGNIGSLTTAHVWDVVSATGDFRAWKNGSAVFTTTSNTLDVSTTSIWIGAQSGPGYTTTWLGHFGQVIVYPFALTTLERASVLAYLQAKWGTP